MNRHIFLIGLMLALGLGAQADATNYPATNAAPAVAAAAGTNDPVAAVQLEYERLMELDNAATEEIDGWIVENQKFEEQGGGVPRDELIRRIQKRRESVQAAYDAFIKDHPNHGDARLAYASFLEDGGDLAGSLEQMLKAKQVDPTNPACWNNLANYYGHFGEVTNAFTHYEKAIELNPQEPVYYQNFGTTVFLFRTDVKQHYGINEQQVFDKALMLYSNAMALAPTNFLLATDVAMTYYGIKPFRYEAAVGAWRYALSLADGELSREGVLLHLARVERNAGNLDAARTYLNSVTNAELADLKARLARSLDSKEQPEEQENPSELSPVTADTTNNVPPPTP